MFILNIFIKNIIKGFGSQVSVMFENSNNGLGVDFNCMNDLWPTYFSVRNVCQYGTWFF